MGSSYRFTVQVRMKAGAHRLSGVLRLKSLGSMDKYIWLGDARASTTGWNLLEFKFKWTQEMADAQSALVHVSGILPFFDVDYDNFAITALAPGAGSLLDGESAESGEEALHQEEGSSADVLVAIVASVVCSALLAVGLYATRRFVRTPKSTDLENPKDSFTAEICCDNGDGVVVFDGEKSIEAKLQLP